MKLNVDATFSSGEQKEATSAVLRDESSGGLHSLLPEVVAFQMLMMLQRLKHMLCGMVIC